jgi:LmbE family N-acetylglucosaminyl deacetylase
MRGLTFAERPRGVLALGAHPDDLEIGCGGTLLRLARRWPGLPVTVVILTGSRLRQEEARRAVELFLAGCDVTLRTFDLPDGRLPSVWGEVKQRLEDVAADLAAGLDGGTDAFEVDVVLAPRTDDAHQDHRLVAELVPTVWRDHLVLGYEIPKYDGDLGRPSLYVPLPVEVAHEKVDLLAKAYASQTGRDWWGEETFLGLARLRGIECRADFAEAFTVTKLALEW